MAQQKRTDNVYEHPVFAMIDRPVAFNRAYVELDCGVTGALFLSQAVYWTRRSPSGWFYKTGSAWTQETGLTRREQESVRQKLRDLGILTEKLRGVPATVHFKVNLDIVMAHLGQRPPKVPVHSGLIGAESSESAECFQFAPNRQTGLHQTAKLVCTKPPNKIAPNRQTISESTQESTTDILPTAAAQPPRERIPFDAIVDLYHEVLAELPAVKLRTDKRRKALKGRWGSNASFQTLEFWRNFFVYIRASDFLMGRKTDFQVSFDWIMNQSNFAKILEGNYENRERSA